MTAILGVPRPPAAKLLHKDVEPAVAETAGSGTSLDAVWGMNISRQAGKPLQIIPYTLKPSLDGASKDEASVKASAFDPAQ